MASVQTNPRRLSADGDLHDRSFLWPGFQCRWLPLAPQYFIRSTDTMRGFLDAVGGDCLSGYSFRHISPCPTANFIGGVLVAVVKRGTMVVRVNHVGIVALRVRS